MPIANRIPIRPNTDGVIGETLTVNIRVTATQAQLNLIKARVLRDALKDRRIIECTIREEDPFYLLGMQLDAPARDFIDRAVYNALWQMLPHGTISNGFHVSVDQ